MLYLQEWMERKQTWWNAARKEGICINCLTNSAIQSLTGRSLDASVWQTPLQEHALIPSSSRSTFGWRKVTPDPPPETTRNLFSKLLLECSVRATTPSRPGKGSAARGNTSAPKVTEQRRQNIETRARRSQGTHAHPLTTSRLERALPLQSYG